MTDRPDWTGFDWLNLIAKKPVIILSFSLSRGGLGGLLDRKYDFLCYKNDDFTFSIAAKIWQME